MRKGSKELLQAITASTKRIGFCSGNFRFQSLIGLLVRTSFPPFPTVLPPLHTSVFLPLASTVTGHRPSSLSGVCAVDFVGVGDSMSLRRFTVSGTRQKSLCAWVPRSWRNILITLIIGKNVIAWIAIVKNFHSAVERIWSTERRLRR